MFTKEGQEVHLCLFIYLSYQFFNFSKYFLSQTWLSVLPNRLFQFLLARNTFFPPNPKWTYLKNKLSSSFSIQKFSLLWNHLGIYLKHLNYHFPHLFVGISRTLSQLSSISYKVLGNMLYFSLQCSPSFICKPLNTS